MAQVTGPHKEASVLVVGGGPAGLTAAIALAVAGIDTVLIGKRPAQPDNRTTALLAGSVATLDALGVWQRCASDAAPLRVMRLVDDTGRLLRAPEVKFVASEISLEAFGYNIENRHLVAALEQRARELAHIEIVDDRVEDIETGSDQVTVRSQTHGSFSAPLAIGADGRNSLCRQAAGISMNERHYPQTALTFCLRHNRPHQDVSTEFHTGSGPFTLVPLPGLRSSLVWVVDPDDAEEILALDDTELAEEIERRSHSILGKIEVEAGRGQFPLMIASAQRFAGRRIALIGEAGHVIPPIGAQGFNLGLRDAGAVAEIVTGAHRAGRDLGGDAVLTRYDRMRRTDIGSRTLAVDMLNRSLLSDFLPLQAARGFGLYLMERIGPLRRALMREGVAVSRTRPQTAGHPSR